MREPEKGPPNRGSVALEALCVEYGDQKRLSKDIGADDATLSRWRRGVRKPDAVMRAKIQARLGIHWQDWDTELPVAPDGEAKEPAA